jgi:choline-glycine betaine transporter
MQQAISTICSANAGLRTGVHRLSAINLADD